MSIRPERVARMRTVLDQRLGWVRCAVEAVYHRHNVSAILRTCDALGLQHVHLVQGDFVPVKGAARGADRWLDLHHEPDTPTAIANLKAAGFAVWVADLAPDSVAPERVPLDTPVCLWLGAELVGVSEAARAAADGVVTVPMHGFSQSLNVSVAGALALRGIAEQARSTLGERALLPDAEREALWTRWMAREEVVRAGARARADVAPPEDP